MPVGFMFFHGFRNNGWDVELQRLLERYRDTKVVIDHMGFFKQPATGGITDK